MTRAARQSVAPLISNVRPALACVEKKTLYGRSVSLPGAHVESAAFSTRSVPAGPVLKQQRGAICRPLEGDRVSDGEVEPAEAVVTQVDRHDSGRIRQGHLSTAGEIAIDSPVGQFIEPVAPEIELPPLARLGHQVGMTRADRLVVAIGREQIRCARSIPRRTGASSTVGAATAAMRSISILPSVDVALVAGSLDADSVRDGVQLPWAGDRGGRRLIGPVARRRWTRVCWGSGSTARTRKKHSARCRHDPRPHRQVPSTGPRRSRYR